MSSIDEQQETPPVVAEIGLGNDGNASAEDRSLFDNLRARRDEIADTKTVTIPIPGFEDFGLAAQYRLVERPEVREVGERVTKEVKDQNERVIALMVDTLIIALDGFVVSEKGKPEPKPLHDPNGTPVHTWSHMALELGGEPADDRDAVYWMFGNNEFAVSQHALLYSRWMGNTSIDIENELGNSI